MISWIVDRPLTKFVVEITAAVFTIMEFGLVLSSVLLAKDQWVNSAFCFGLGAVFVGYIEGSLLSSLRDDLKKQGKS